MKPAPAACLVFAALTAPAFAADLPKGTPVRIEGTGIEAGWHEGTITVTGDGCTMVALKKPTKDGYTMIALIATSRLQRLQNGTWNGVAVKDLLAGQPKTCLEEGSD